jgi:hypothetical protein
VDDMALVGILSTQLVHQQFVADFRLADVKPAHLKMIEKD